MTTDTAEVRAFNRFYTRVVGLLDEHVNHSPYSLQEARVIYEIGTRGHAKGAELARALGVDPAYVSRIIMKLLGEGLLIATPSVSDRRSNQIALSREGDAVFAALDGGSNAAVEAMLAPLDESRRRQLVAAMRAIRRALGDAPGEAHLVLRPQRLGEIGWLIHRQGLLYNQQFGWNEEFEALIARIYGDYAALPDDGRKALWVADRGGVVLGSVFVVPAEGRERTAQLRMLYVEPEARGLGLGTALVRQAVAFARGAGYAQMRLWTQAMLVSARRIYAAEGFRCVASSPHHSFGMDLVDEHWELELQNEPTAE